MDGCYSPPPPHPLNPSQFLTTPPGRVAQPDEWEPGRAQARGQSGQQPQTTVPSFLHTASAWPRGCLLGRQGVEVGTPSHFLQDRPLPGICESWNSPLPSACIAPWAPHLADTPLQVSLLALAGLLLLLGALPLEDEDS